MQYYQITETWIACVQNGLSIQCVKAFKLYSRKVEKILACQKREKLLDNKLFALKHAK